MTSVNIRPLRKSDRQNWEQLWADYLDFYETKLPVQVFQSSFERLMSNAAHEFHGLIAERDGRAVGLAHFLIHRTMWSVRDTCYLMDLFTAKDARGAGIGRALIEAVHDAAREAGAADLYWHTAESNKRAQALYDTLATKTDFLHYEKKITPAP